MSSRRKKSSCPFVAPHEEKEDSQSYYSENSEEEDMQLAYQLQHVEFLKLREKYK
jgi:hypothetical protein